MYMNKVHTNLTIDGNLLEKAKVLHINISQLLEDALNKRINLQSSAKVGDPFENQEVKAMLPETAKFLKQNPGFAEGRSRLIYNKTGVLIEPEKLLKKLGIRKRS